MAVSLGSAVLTIGGDSTGLGQALGRAETMTKATMQNVAQVSRAAGYTLVSVGASISTALGLAVREAISFESAFAGVRKTMDGSEADFAAIEEELRKMSLEMPISAEALAHIAETAAQMGVPKEQLANFTRVMAEMGIATNLSADEAAALVATIMDLTGADYSQVERIASAIVALGNNGKSTERDIANMAARLAGAASVANMSTQDILGLSTGLADARIETEMGSTAFQNFIIAITRATFEGGDKLNVFAQVAGMTAQDFVDNWRTAPTETLLKFIEGLKGVAAAGGDMFGVVSQMGVDGSRLTQVLLKAALTVDNFREQVRRANTASRENVALQDEVTKRFATTDSQLGILKNTVMELARQVGGALLPIIRDLVERARDAVQYVIAWVKANPELTAEIVKWAAAIGVVATALGPLLIALPGVAIAVSAIGATFAAVVSPMGAVIALIVGGVIVALLALKDHMDAAREWVRANWERIAAAFQAARQVVVTVMQILAQVLRGAFLVISALITGFAESVGGALTKSSGTIGQYKDDFLGHVQYLLQRVNDLLPRILQIVQVFVQWVNAHWEEMVAGAKSAYDNIVAPLVAMANLFLNVAAKIVGAVNTIASALGALGVSPQDVFGALFPGASLLGNSLGGGNNVEQYAMGGVTRRPGLAYVHADELVAMPAGARVFTKRDTAELLGGAGGGLSVGGVTVHVHGVTDPRAIAAQVGVELEREVQNVLAKRGLRMQRA